MKSSSNTASDELPTIPSSWPAAQRRAWVANWASAVDRLRRLEQQRLAALGRQQDEERI